MKLLAAIMMGIIALVSWSTASRADEAFFYSSTTAGGPLFTRPNATAPPFTSSGVVTRYHVQQFQVNQATTCVINGIQNGNFDGFLHIYQAAFDPLVPLQNGLAANDDDSTGLFIGSSRIVPPFAVLANTPYIVVTSAFSQATDGTFTNMISCNSITGSLVGPTVITHGAGGNLGTTKALLGNRFQASATFTSAPGGPVSNAQLTQFGSDDSALFTFFEPTNWELLIKVRNFCGSPDQLAWRVFAAGTTTLGVTVTVVDTLRGGTTTIINPLNSPFQNQVLPVPLSCP